MAIRYDRVYPPSYTDKRKPRCPECLGLMFYVGKTPILNEGQYDEYRLYQCCKCLRLFREIRESLMRRRKYVNHNQ